MNLAAFKGFEYEAQDAETEVMLSEVPLNIILASIENQFNDPIEYQKTDFVQSFLTKYQVSKENVIVGTDEEQELQKLYEKFLSSIELIFQEKLGVGIPELDDMSEDDQLETVHFMYRYFIINLRKNFTAFILKWIQENKHTFVEELPKREDTTTVAMREYIQDVADIAIITNIPTVVKMALSDDDVDVDKFLSYSHGKDSNLENEFITEAFDEFKITGNFVESYKKILNEDIIMEIESKVRNKILKKYRKK